MTDSISIDKNGAWRLYSPAIPAGSVAVGTVRRALGDTGALIRFTRTGLFAQCNAGVVRNLDQGAVNRVLSESADATR